MAPRDRYEAGRSSTEPAMRDLDYERIWERVSTAANAVCAECSKHESRARDISDIAQSMVETHQSMRSVYSSAGRIEENGEKTGRFADTLLLARPQFDALFVGLLLAIDYKHWGPIYRKASWATEAKRAFYVYRRHRSLPTSRNLHSSNLKKLKTWARGLNLTTQQWVATLAEVRGKELRCGATSKDAIETFPTPGQVMSQDTFVGGPYERVAQLIWQQWKFLCDPAHIGMSILVIKGALRHETTLEGTRREEYLQQKIVVGAFNPSFVAILTLLTVLATMLKPDADIRGRVVQAWTDLDEGTTEGELIWNEWAREALGVMNIGS